MLQNANSFEKSIFVFYMLTDTTNNKIHNNAYMRLDDIINILCV